MIKREWIDYACVSNFNGVTRYDYWYMPGILDDREKLAPERALIQVSVWVDERNWIERDCYPVIRCEIQNRAEAVGIDVREAKKRLAKQCPCAYLRLHEAGVLDREFKDLAESMPRLWRHRFEDWLEDNAVVHWIGNRLTQRHDRSSGWVIECLQQNQAVSLHRWFDVSERNHRLPEQANAPTPIGIEAFDTNIATEFARIHQLNYPSLLLVHFKDGMVACFGLTGILPESCPGFTPQLYEILRSANIVTDYKLWVGQNNEHPYWEFKCY